jgi:hypothetical protein
MPKCENGKIYCNCGREMKKVEESGKEWNAREQTYLYHWRCLSHWNEREYCGYDGGTHGIWTAEPEQEAQLSLF